MRRAARAGYALVLATQLCSAVVLLLGGIGAALFLHGRQRAVAGGETAAPLTPEERQRLDRLLREDT